MSPRARARAPALAALAAFALLAPGCGGDDGVDFGPSASDAPAPFDAAVPVDASAPLDASVPADASAGLDAPTALDATTSRDATVDAGAGDADTSDGAAPESGVCLATQTACDGLCVSTDVDPRHCGACNNACGPGATCAAGRCRCDGILGFPGVPATVTGGAPTAVAMADLNGDAKPDLVTVSSSGGAVTVQLGNGNGTFRSGVGLTAGASPASLTLADLNGDGRPDLAVADSVSPTLSVFINTTPPGAGAPTFGAKTDVATGGHPSAVAAADLNSDGVLDLAVANSADATVSALLNTTAPGATTAAFAPKTDMPSGPAPTSLAVADVNSDGKPDLATGNGSGSAMSVILNTTAAGASSASFAGHVEVGNVAGTAIAFAELNGDGKPDAVVAHRTSMYVSVLLNTTAPGATTPSFATELILSSGGFPTAVALRDLNDDGRTDLAVTMSVVGEVYVFTNVTAPGASAATFQLEALRVAAEPSSLAIADVNLDGRSDLAVGVGGGTVNVLLNTAAPGASAPSFPTPLFELATSNDLSVALLDVNADGRPDLAAANESSSTLSLLLNTTAAGAASPKFAARVNLPSGANPMNVASGDFNADGKPDLVLTEASDNAVGVYLNTTAPLAVTPSFASRADFATAAFPYGLAVVDIDGDGKPDVVSCNSNNTSPGAVGSISVLLNTTAAGAAAASFGAHVEFPVTAPYPYNVAWGDLNGDGKTDLAVGTAAFLNTTPLGASAPTFASATLPFGSEFFELLTDVNADGTPDLVVVYPPSQIAVLVNTTLTKATTLSFASAVMFSVGTRPYAVASGDVDGDGKPDLVIADNAGATATILLNGTPNGASAAVFGARLDYVTGKEPYWVALADLNADGRLDLTLATRGTNDVSVLPSACLSSANGL